MGRKKWNPAEEAEDQRDMAKQHAAISRAARAVGADKVADATRRNAATANVVARYLDAGRCQFGHANCTAGDH